MKSSTGIILVFAAVFIIGKKADGQQEEHFQFRKDKTFKIAQFSDLHWDNTSENCSETIAVIENVLNAESPDLAVLTGDVVTSPPAVEGWKAVAQPFIDAKIPWAVTLGNHDAEPGISRDEIFELLEQLPFFVGEKGPDLYGCGNYTVSVWSSDNTEVAAVLYFFDSNDYTKRKFGGYDWIHFDQINWYRNLSMDFTRNNNNAPLPSIAFFHIPLQEYFTVIDQTTTVGAANEGSGASKVNSGLFASFLEMNDVMGTFVGHDHDNNYIGIHDGIALAFGQVTGMDAYGTLDRGGRIISLNEGAFSFDTWLRTGKGAANKYNYPAGLSYDDENAVYSPAVEVGELSRGVRYKYYEGNFSSAKELVNSKEIKEGVLNNFSFEPADQKDHFGFEYNTYLFIEKKGTYLFDLYADDGAVLFIDDKEVVNNDGSHSLKNVEGKIALETGYHTLRLIYFEDYMGEELQVRISGINIRDTQIPESMLFIKDK